MPTTIRLSEHEYPRVLMCVRVQCFDVCYSQQVMVRLHAGVLKSVHRTSPFRSFTRVNPIKHCSLRSIILVVNVCARISPRVFRGDSLFVHHSC